MLPMIHDMMLDNCNKMKEQVSAFSGTFIWMTSNKEKEGALMLKLRQLGRRRRRAARREWLPLLALGSRRYRGMGSWVQPGIKLEIFSYKKLGEIYEYLKGLDFRSLRARSSSKHAKCLFPQFWLLINRYFRLPGQKVGKHNTLSGKLESGRKENVNSSRRCSSAVRD